MYVNIDLFHGNGSVLVTDLRKMANGSVRVNFQQFSFLSEFRNLRIFLLLYASFLQTDQILILLYITLTNAGLKQNGIHLVN